jgi:hypothetical protein
LLQGLDIPKIASRKMGEFRVDRRFAYRTGSIRSSAALLLDEPMNHLT